MKRLIALSVATLFMSVSLYGCSRQADENTPGSPGATGEVDPYLNSQERMEERSNNSSIIIESDQSTEWDGADKQEGRSPREVKALEQADKRRMND